MDPDDINELLFEVDSIYSSDRDELLLHAHSNSDAESNDDVIHDHVLSQDYFGLREDDTGGDYGLNILSFKYGDHINNDTVMLRSRSEA